MIRAARVQDAEALAAIYNEYVLNSTISFETEPLTAAIMRERITRTAAHFPFLVYEEAGNVYGYCYAHDWKARAAYRHTWETTIYLHPTACGRGIGRQLMTKLISDCRAAGCHTLIACITGDNTTSCQFHRHLGFEPASHFYEVGYKFGKWLDVTDYQLIL